MGVKDAVGLDIGTSGVRAAHLNLAKSPPSLENFGQVSVPASAMREGEVTDPGVIGDAIAQLWKAARFSLRNVHLCVANQKVVARTIDMTYVTAQELRGAISFQVQEHIPMPVDDAVLDFKVLEEFTNERGDAMIRVLVVAAQKQMIQTLVDVLKPAKLHPISIDFTPLSLIRSIGQSNAFGVGGGGEALIDIGASVTCMVVHEGGIPRLARVLGIGGNSLTEALSQGMGIPFDDADLMKQRMGIVAPAPFAQSPSPQVPPGPEMTAPPEGAGQILESKLGGLVDQIRQSVDYYNTQPGAGRITRVALSGGSSKLPGLAPRLATALNLPVEPGQPLKRLRKGKVRLTDMQLADAEPLMAASVGAALGALSQ